MSRGPETIAAIATAAGRGGIGIVRVSGAKTRDIAQQLLGAVPPARTAVYTKFLDAAGQAMDLGLALFFPAPHSFTGEDVLELHGHGGPVVLDLVLVRTLELGARLAHPGEFSERAFLNGKLDLAQAEAIADLIDAGSQAAARGALRSLEGEFSQRVQALTEGLIDLRLYIEAAIDFPEEEIDFLADIRLVEKLTALQVHLSELLASTQQGVVLHDGLTVVLAGAPNVGKSSLLNALAQTEAAIVSPVPGTTRDVLKERIAIDGLPLHVIDTAGLRATHDAIEVEGIRRAQAQLARADRVLLLVDAAHPDTAAQAAAEQYLPAALPRTVIRNKIDLTGEAPQQREHGGVTEISLSARSGAGLALLREHLKACASFQAAGEGTFTARRRHLAALERAATQLARAHQHLAAERAGELAAEDLRLAQQALAEITGAFTPDDLLGRIFAGFCIGK